MGYYTYYVLDVRRCDGKQVDGELLKEIYRQLVDINSYEFERYSTVEHEEIDYVYELNQLLFPDQTKWYDHDDEDKWRMFYLNGMCGGGAAQIIYPEFDISTMRRPEENVQ